MIYDYTGEEEYNAFYLMADANIGEKLNIVTGLRNETNETYTKYAKRQANRSTQAISKQLDAFTNGSQVIRGPQDTTSNIEGEC